MTSALYRNDRPATYPDSWYTASTDLPAERPALLGEKTVDVAIVGAGYCGLTAALTLARKGYSVAVVEAHRVGFGASGRNGGQVGSGFNRDQRWLARTLGADTARKLWFLAEEAKALVRAQVAEHAPDARYTPGVLHGQWTSVGVDEDHRYADFLAREYGYETEPLTAAPFREICNSPIYQGGVLDMGAGHLHPLRYVLGLARAAEAAGAVIHERTEARELAPNLVLTGQGRLRAQHILLCGNGYLPDIDRRYAARVMPINSFIAATAPLGDRAAAVLARDVAVADDKFVVNYFRFSEDRRLLFGGRESYTIGFPRDIVTALRARMERLFPQLAGVAIDHHWGGTLGITMTRLPYLAEVRPGVLAAGGFSGHGVAISTLAGQILGEAVAGQAERFDLMGKLPVPQFPGGALARAPLLTLAMTWYSLRDRLGI